MAANLLIRKIEHLHPLSPEERSVLDGAVARVAEVGADKDLVREGDAPGACNVLLQGAVCRYKILPDGKRQIFSFQFPGDVFDIHSFILERMDHSIGSLTPCRIGVIPHPVVRQITEAYPRIARALWKDSLIDAAVHREWMASIGRRSAITRVAHLMCEVYLRLAAVDLARGNSLDWPFTQVEIGDSLGLSLVHVNRTLQSLRRDGLITLREGTLTIHDWEALKRVGQFDPTYMHLRFPKDGSASYEPATMGGV